MTDSIEYDSMLTSTPHPSDRNCPGNVSLTIGIANVLENIASRLFDKTHFPFLPHSAILHE